MSEKLAAPYNLIEIFSRVFWHSNGTETAEGSRTRKTVVFLVLQALTSDYRPEGVPLDIICAVVAPCAPIISDCAPAGGVIIAESAPAIDGLIAPRRLAYRAATTTDAINRQARAAARDLARATYADRQRQQREQWRQTANALAQHRGANTSHTEDIRKAQAGLRAEQKAGNRAGVQAWLRLLRQLHGNQQPG